MTEKFPTPWCVGPFGCIWVAADVELKDGKWRERCANPRLVVDTGTQDKDLAEQIVNAVNAAASAFPRPVLPGSEKTGEVQS